MILADILQEIGIACLAWAGVMILFAQIEWIEWNFEQWSTLIVIPLGIGISPYVSNLLVREYGGFIENSDALRKQEVDLVSELTNCSI